MFARCLTARALPARLRGMDLKVSNISLRSTQRLFGTSFWGCARCFLLRPLRSCGPATPDAFRLIVLLQHYPALWYVALPFLPLHNPVPMYDPETLQTHRIFPTWTWMVYLALFALSIPWYLPESIAMRTALGLPVWLVGCIGAVLGMACFTVWVISRYWQD